MSGVGPHAARAHALAARELLESLDRFAERIRNQTPQERLEALATGAVRQANEDMRWTADLAVAHALAAIALAITDRPE